MTSTVASGFNRQAVIAIYPELTLSWLAKGDIQPARIVTGIIPLGDIVAQRLEVLAGKIEVAIKILVAP